MLTEISRRTWLGAIAAAAAASQAEAAEPGMALGTRAHFLARPQYREALVKCFAETLGCGPAMWLPTKAPVGPVAAFRFPGGGSVSVEFTDGALDELQARRGAWLELRTADPDALETAVTKAGLPRITYPATTTFYFAVPGGQVFGITRSDRPELKG